jgi:methionyl-tRNA formyltransferase
MLEAPRRGCLNIHASLLPRWRGASPIQAAIRAGDAESGVTIMRMDEGLDTGAMLLSEAVEITRQTTAPILHDALAGIGARLILRALDEDPPAVPQPRAGATYAGKLTREDGRIDWSRGAEAIERQVRALNPWPGTFAMLNGEVLKVLACEAVPGEGRPGQVLEGLTVAAGEGAVRLLRVQRSGRAAATAEAYLRGNPVASGTILR